MKRMLASVLILVLLLSGCSSSGGLGNGTEPSDILSSQPTNPTNESTVPATEATQPPTAPTAPTTEPTTEPTVFPTDYLGNDITEELIAAALEWAGEWTEVTDYHAEIRVDENNDYHVILDGEKYLYDILFWYNSNKIVHVYCTPKAGTVYPNGPALPPGDMTEEEFRKTYTILDDLLTDRSDVQVKMAEVKVGIACPLPDALDGAAVQTADGKPVFCHHGRLYIWEEDTVFRDIGYLFVSSEGSLFYALIDGEYALTLDFEHTELTMVYRVSGEIGTRAVFKYDLNGSTSIRLDVIDFDSAEVKCVEITEKGEVEVTPYYHYDYYRDLIN